MHRIVVRVRKGLHGGGSMIVKDTGVWKALECVRQVLQWSLPEGRKRRQNRMREEAGSVSYHQFVRPDLRVGMYLEASSSKMLECGLGVITPLFRAAL